MNQLQNLLHDALISTEHVQQCAIVRRKDCSIRASSVGFNVSNLFHLSLHQLLLQFYTDHFETLHVFSSWYEDVHVVWI